MKRLHLTVGIIGVAAFLITGQFMRYHTPPMATLSDSARLMFRSRHIYILGAALANLMLGLYFEPGPRSWRRVVQAAGSVLLMTAPALLLLAFAVEPSLGLREEMRWSQAGLYALFGGSMAHLVSFQPASPRGR